MTKLKVLVLALFAMFALSTAVAATASAEAGDKWLNLAGAEPSETGTEALTDGFVLLHHVVPGILGGGEITIKCEGQFHGKVFKKAGSNGTDTVEDVLGLKGELSNVNGGTVHCEVSATTNANCKVGELVSVKADNLPWNSELLLENNITYDDVLNGGKGEPGYETECGTPIKIKTLCSSHDRSKFIMNLASNAEFKFEGELVAKCGDGGTGTVLGEGKVLNWLVST